MEIQQGLDFAFETTLGGKTIAVCGDALAAGSEVRIWYAGLSSAEITLPRVAARVARGGTRFPRETFGAGIKKSTEHNSHADAS